MSLEIAIDRYINNKIIPYTFAISQSPILFHDLLEANRLIKDGMTPESGSLGYRMKLGHTYILFFILAHIIFVLPAMAIFHIFLTKLDCHLSVIAAVVFTGLFFTSFTIFKEFLLDRISMTRVKEGWKLHFPLFDFETYSPKVAKIYAEAIRKKVARGELEFFIMSEIAKEQ
jgi:hypothetical protein